MKDLTPAFLTPAFLVTPAFLAEERLECYGKGFRIVIKKDLTLFCFYQERSDPFLFLSSKATASSNTLQNRRKAGIHRVPSANSINNVESQ